MGNIKKHSVRLFFINKKALVGYEYGLETWKMQVTPTLNFNQYNPGDSIDIYWDSDVKLMTSSFVRGFFHELVDKIGIDGIITDTTFHNLDNNTSKLDIVEDLLF